MAKLKEYYRKTLLEIEFVVLLARYFVVAASIVIVACLDNSSKPTAPTVHTIHSYYCSLNGVTYNSEANYRSFCVAQPNPQSNTSISYSSQNISSSSTSPNTSSSIPTTPKETTQRLSCQGIYFVCSTVYAISAKQACESLEQNLVVNGMNLSGLGKKQAIQTMVQYNCKCVSDKELKDYMTSVGCL